MNGFVKLLMHFYAFVLFFRVTYPPEMFYLGKGNSDEGWLSTCGQRGFVPLYLLGALYMFLGLAIICDDFFVPSLEASTEHFHFICCFLRI